MVSQSSTEVEYRVMTNLTCDLVWVKDLLSELGFTLGSPIRMYCDNLAPIHIAENLVFNECAKYVEIYCYLVHKKVA